MAATGASSVAGGNFQIFEKFVEHSKATVRLNTTVRSLPALLMIRADLKPGDSHPTRPYKQLARPYKHGG